MEVYRSTYTGEPKNLLELLQEDGVFLPADCGGRGVCGRCRVRFVTSADADTICDAERACLSEAELAAGWRLACMQEVTAPVVIEYEQAEEEMLVETGFSGGQAADGAEDSSDKAAAALRTGNESKTDSTADESLNGQNPEAGNTDSLCVAVDIGTTTIAASLVDAAAGTVKNTVTSVNHQRSFGADVISRIQASNDGKGDQLQKSIEEDLQRMVRQLGVDPAAVETIISGNTTMEHLLLGYSCETLGIFPFTPVDISLQKKGNRVILPGISTYVGADIVSGIIACGMDKSEEVCVLVDLGTNGEMVIGSRDRMMAASTAAGPAFEGGNIFCGVAGVPGAIDTVTIRSAGEPAEYTTIGGKTPVGLCGTGVIEVMYELLKNEIVDETGLMDDEYEDDGFPLYEGIVFTDQDIREVQLAKSAIRAGIETLLISYGVSYEEIGHLYLAGGFGQKINLEKAAGIGLLPKELLPVTEAVGNSSLAGAIMLAKDPSLSGRFEQVASETKEVSLSESREFNELYMEHMFFPEEF